MEEYESLQKLNAKDPLIGMEEVDRTSVLGDMCHFNKDTQDHLAGCMSTPSGTYPCHNGIFTDMNGQQHTLSAPEESIDERNKTAHCTKVFSDGEEPNCHIQNMTGEISDIMDKSEDENVF